MTREKARSVIVEAWVKLHPQLRTTDKQARMFAEQAIRVYRFPEAGDRVEVVVEWLRQAAPW